MRALRAFSLSSCIRSVVFLRPVEWPDQYIDVVLMREKYGFLILRIFDVPVGLELLANFGDSPYVHPPGLQIVTGPSDESTPADYFGRHEVNYRLCRY